MLKKLITFGTLACTLGLPQLGHAQAGPTATRLSHIQLGGGFSYARTDYGQRGDKGLTIFGDYDLASTGGPRPTITTPRSQLLTAFLRTHLPSGPDSYSASTTSSCTAKV